MASAMSKVITDNTKPRFAPNQNGSNKKALTTINTEAIGNKNVQSYGIYNKNLFAKTNTSNKITSIIKTVFIMTLFAFFGMEKLKPSNPPIVFFK